jgi:hypothetical protein
VHGLLAVPLSIVSLTFRSLRLSSRLFTFCAFAFAATGFTTSHASPFFSRTTLVFFVSSLSLPGASISSFVILSASSFDEIVGLSADETAAAVCSSSAFARLFELNQRLAPSAARRARAK